MNAAIETPVLPSQVECWRYDGDALVGHRDHDYEIFGNPGSRAVQGRCSRCGDLCHDFGGGSSD